MSFYRLNRVLSRNRFGGGRGRCTLGRGLRPSSQENVSQAHLFSSVYWQSKAYTMPLFRIAIGKIWRGKLECLEKKLPTWPSCNSHSVSQEGTTSTILLIWIFLFLLACGRMCQNGGTLDGGTCTCNCVGGFFGNKCESECIVRMLADEHLHESFTYGRVFLNQCPLCKYTHLQYVAFTLTWQCKTSRHSVNMGQWP